MGRKILFIDHDDGRTGSTVSLEYLIDKFFERGYTVSLLTPKKIQNTKIVQSSGISLIPFRDISVDLTRIDSHFTNLRTVFSIKGSLYTLREIYKFYYGVKYFKRVYDQVKPDVVYVNEHVLMAASYAAYRKGIPSVLQMRSSLLKGIFGIRRKIFSWILLKSNRKIIAISDIEASQLCYPEKEKQKVVVVGEFSPRRKPALQREEQINAFNIPHHKRIITMLGGIEEVKGTILFLQAARLIVQQYSNIFFVVAGKPYQRNDGYFDQCMNILATLKKIRGGVFLGEIENPLDLIALSDIIISPSTVSHFSRPIIEAWAYSLPVIASDTDHMRNLITDGIDGLLFRCGDYSDLSRCICRLLGNRELCRNLGDQGNKKNLMQFNAEKNLNVIADIVDQLN